MLAVRCGVVGVAPPQPILLSRRKPQVQGVDDAFGDDILDTEQFILFHLESIGPNRLAADRVTESCDDSHSPAARGDFPCEHQEAARGARSGPVAFPIPCTMTDCCPARRDEIAFASPIPMLDPIGWS